MANVECRKFAPNIFNKSKCSNCFRLKEDHSASAIELNKASRKISKCGYLFVAPDWDFSNPINRTKRWQRRWFVLFDDGELTYSVDDHPETIPQVRLIISTSEQDRSRLILKEEIRVNMLELLHLALTRVREREG